MFDPTQPLVLTLDPKSDDIKRQLEHLFYAMRDGHPAAPAYITVITHENAAHVADLLEPYNKSTVTISRRAKPGQPAPHYKMRLDAIKELRVTWNGADVPNPLGGMTPQVPANPTDAELSHIFGAEMSILLMHALCVRSTLVHIAQQAIVYCGGPALARAWFLDKVLELDDTSPRDLLLSGKSSVLIDFFDAKNEDAAEGDGPSEAEVEWEGGRRRFVIVVEEGVTAAAIGPFPTEDAQTEAAKEAYQRVLPRYGNVFWGVVETTDPTALLHVGEYTEEEINGDQLPDDVIIPGVAEAADPNESLVSLHGRGVGFLYRLGNPDGAGEFHRVSDTDYGTWDDATATSALRNLRSELAERKYDKPQGDPLRDAINEWLVKVRGRLD